MLSVPQKPDYFNKWQFYPLKPLLLTNTSQSGAKNSNRGNNYIKLQNTTKPNHNQKVNLTLIQLTLKTTLLQIPSNMNKTATKKAVKAPIHRNKYTATHRSEAKRFYLLGLNLNEISKLLDIPFRTLENWQTVDKWVLFKTVEPIKKQALRMSEAGKTYNEIAETLNINKVTVWRYLKQAKTEK